VSSRFGHPRVHHRLTDSTNARARDLALAGAPDGTVVTAAEQSAGRGRQGRTWTAPPGKALLMSAIVRGLGRRDALLPLAVPVAVAEACDAFAGGRTDIKWPNDVWVGGRKLAGILLEGRPQEGWAVIGVGLNVSTTAEEFPEELREQATSLAIAGGGDPGVDAVFGAVLNALDRRLGDRPESILSAWRERDLLLGKTVRWNGGQGTAAGLDDSGALLVDTGDGRVALDAGEVHLLRGDPLGAEVAELWTRSRDEMMRRVDVVEAAVSAVAAGALGEQQQEAATSAAHGIAGTAGTFGFPDASRRARAIELALRDGASAADAPRLSELAAAIRSDFARRDPD
jgi:BirA family biotin operon repressor/biotin-[acetyl-CoA-carboxylase] ligase